jgi:hypothetical protein
MFRITDSLALLAIEAGQVNNPSEQSGAAGSSRLDVDQRSIDIGEPVPIVFGLRREDKGGILISPGASECRFENDVSNNVTAYYHLVLSEGRLEIVETLDVFQRACRVGEHVQGYGARAGFWEPGNFLVKRGSNPIPEATYICGSIGLYPDITSLSFKVTIPSGFDQWKKQVHVFIRYGMKVKRFLQRGTGASDNFCDLVLWMLRSSKRVPEALIDLEQLAASARFLEANGLTCNCYIKEAQNYSDLIAKWAPYFLLIPSNRNGKKGLRPVLPTNSDGTINTSPVTIEYTFDEDLIVPDSFSVEYTNFADRQPFVAQVIWRQELGDEAPIMRTLEIGAPGSDRELGPFESFDLSEICTSENHAAKAGAFIVANRVFVSHVITFTPKPQSHQTLLSVGSIIRVVLTRLTLGAQPCKHDYLYQVQKIYKNFDGETQYDCRHFPVNPERQSIVALAVAGAEGTGILLESPKTGVTCDTNTGGTTGSEVTGGDGEGTTQPRCYQTGAIGPVGLFFVGGTLWVCEGEPEGEKWEKNPDNDTWEFTGDEDPTGPGWEFDEEEEKWKWTGDEDPTDPGWEFDEEEEKWKWTGDEDPTDPGWEFDEEEEKWKWTGDEDPTDPGWEFDEEEEKWKWTGDEDPTDPGWEFDEEEEKWKWTGDEDPTDPGWEFDPEDDTWKWTGDGEPTGDGWQYDPIDDTWKWTGDGEPTGDGWQYDPTDDTWKWTGDGDPTGDGWQYDPTDDTWKWTGDGDPTGDGWQYDPIDDTWKWTGDGDPTGDGWQYDPIDDTWKWTGDGDPTGDGWGFDPEEDEWIWAGDGVPPGDDPVSLGTIDDPNSGTGPALGALPGADLGDFGGIGDIGGGGALGGSGSSEGDGEGLGEVEANPSDGGDDPLDNPYEDWPEGYPTPADPGWPSDIPPGDIEPLPPPDGFVPPPDTWNPGLWDSTYSLGAYTLTPFQFSGGQCISLTPSERPAFGPEPIAGPIRGIYKATVEGPCAPTSWSIFVIQGTGFGTNFSTVISSMNAGGGGAAGEPAVTFTNNFTPFL